MAIYHEVLSDIPAAQLDAACRRDSERPVLSETGRRPNPYRSCRAALAERRAEAEDAWRFALDYCVHHFRPGLPNWRRRAPALAPKIEEAIARAGGFGWLESCPESELQWAKKKFLEALSNLAELEKAADLLPSGGEARSILRQLAARSELCAPRNLPPVPADCGGAPPLHVCEKDREQLVMRSTPSPPPMSPPATPPQFSGPRLSGRSAPITAEIPLAELERRRAQQLQGLREWQQRLAAPEEAAVLEYSL